MIKNIGLHHFGPPSPNLTLSQLNTAHKARWPDFPSELRPDLFVGYNFVIWKDGSWLQARFVGEETAAQKGHNFDTVSICLQGDFSVGKDSPTPAQISTLAWLMRMLVSGNPVGEGIKVKSGTVLDINQKDIYPHRILQPNHTECNGSSLADDWGKNLISSVTKPDIILPSIPPPPSGGPALAIWKQIAEKVIELLNQLIGRRTALGRATESCISNVRG